VENSQERPALSTTSVELNECYLKSVDVKSSRIESLDVPRRKSNLPREILARNIRLLRAQQDLSQEDLADLAGLHRTYIGSIERSERNVSIDNIAKIAEALGVSIVQMFSA